MQPVLVRVLVVLAQGRCRVAVRVVAVRVTVRLAAVGRVLLARPWSIGSNKQSGEQQQRSAWHCEAECVARPNLETRSAYYARAIASRRGSAQFSTALRALAASMGSDTGPDLPSDGPEARTAPASRGFAARARRRMYYEKLAGLVRWCLRACKRSVRLKTTASPAAAATADGAGGAWAASPRSLASCARGCTAAGAAPRRRAVPPKTRRPSPFSCC